MKPHFLAYIILYVLLAMLTACGNGRRSYKIAVSQCASGQWREKVNQEMLAAQHLYEHDTKVSICDAHDDVARQISQIDSLSLTGIDLLVVAPAESAPLADAIARVRQKGIPVVFFDRKASTDDYTAFIGGNNEEVGRTIGHYALSLAEEPAGQRPLVMEITGDMNSSPARERHAGFASVVQGLQADYVSRDGGWSSDKAYQLVTEQIERGRVPGIVFCHNDGMATGVYKALVETKKEGETKIIGIDGLPGEGIEYVQFGHQVATYIYPTHGEEVVRLALDILTHRPFERNHTLQGMIVTRDNADLIDLNSRELMRQNDNLITIETKLERYFGLVGLLNKIVVVTVITIILLVVAVILIWRALVQTRRTIRHRQAMNEEQTRFYTDASSRKIHQIFDKPDDDLPPPRTQDVIFAEQLNEAIRQRMHNPNLKVDELGDALGLSRVQLYRKVKAITGLSPVELLRQMRLQRGYALLQTTTKTVSEVAYEVGFGTPGYFSKCFKQQFGKYPTELRAE